MLFLSYILCIVHLYINWLCRLVCSHIKDGVCLETTKMRIKVKTDRYGLPIALSPSNYVFCSHKRVSIS